jgi:hypothetical protein
LFVASPVLLQLLHDCPGLGELRLEVGDDDFEPVADLLNVAPIQIKDNEVRSLHELGMALDLRQLTDATRKYFEKLKSGLSLLARVVDCQDMLLLLSRDKLDLTVVFTENGGWLETAEDVKELVLTVLTLVDARHEYLPVLAADLRRVHDKHPGSIIKQFTETKVLHDSRGWGFFAGHWYKQGLLDIEADGSNQV